MYYKQLPRQILSYDFDEKSEFLNYKILDTVTSHYSIKKGPSFFLILISKVAMQTNNYAHETKNIFRGNWTT